MQSRITFNQFLIASNGAAFTDSRMIECQPQFRVSVVHRCPYVGLCSFGRGSLFDLREPRFGTRIRTTNQN